MKNKYPIRAKNETGDVTVDVQEFVVPDSAITAGSGYVNLATATGDVTGPASATNEAATVFDGTTGKTVKDGAAVNVLQKRAVESFTTTATAAGTTTLTVASNPIQEFTGVTTQTVVLPVVTTLPKTGFQFTIINNSTGAVTVNSSGANAVQVMSAGTVAVFTCILLTGTTAASWDATYISNPTSPAVATLTDGATVTWTFNGAEQLNAKVTLGGNRTLAISGATTGASGTLVVIQGAGGQTLALPASSYVVNAGAGVATLSAGAGDIDILSFLFDGTNYYWTVGLDFTAA